MEALITILKELPKWALAVFVYGLVVMMIITVFAGPFKFRDEEFGFDIRIWPWRQNNDTTIAHVTKPKDVLEWYQREYVAMLGRTVSKDVQVFVKKIYECYPTFKDSPQLLRQNVIPKNDASKIIKDDQLGELRSSIVSLLNYFEGISTAYLNGVADKAMFEISFKRTIGIWFGRLEGFMEVYKADCACDFPPFEQLGKLWKASVVTPVQAGEISSCVK